MALLTIEEAAALLAQHSGTPKARDSVRHILMAGAESRIRIYWRNSDQRFSRLFGFAGEVGGSARVIRSMHVPAFAIGKLETRVGIDVAIFEPTDDDWTQLEQLRSVDADGE